MIDIKSLGNDRWQVTVTGTTTTQHEVRVPEATYRKLALGDVSVERLIEKSFEFLLARESNTSILRQFELRVISDYFPDYESRIRELLVD